MIVIRRYGIRYTYLITCDECCPYCFSNNISNCDPPEYGKFCVYQSVECHDCGEMWEESYKKS